ncbi:MAG: hypothetical protein BWY74_03515 [Firmicutes bacterium ADurb.Bin419]|nr:MAG: hypothetical protein BWY74_03515 [Firmicutes bacterium ADurb.Bin419]
MKRKNTVLLVLILSLLCSVLLPSSMQTNLAAQQSNDQITILLNGEKLSFDVEPYIKEGRTLVPFRGILEALGAEVIWNPTERSVTAKSSSTEVYLKIGSVDTLVNGNKVVIDVPAEITNDRTFVPLRFVSENLGATVDWDGTTRTVAITTKIFVVEPDDDPVASSGDKDHVATLKIGDVFDNGRIQIVIDKVEISNEDKKLYIYGKGNFNGNMIFLGVKNTNEYIEYAFFDTVGDEKDMKSFKASADWKSAKYNANKIIVTIVSEDGDEEKVVEINI